MATTLLKTRNLLTIAALVSTIALMVFLNKGLANYENQPQRHRGIRAGGASLINKVIVGKRLSSIAEAETLSGFSLKAPPRLFGKKAQLFLSNTLVGPNKPGVVKIVYSNKSAPTNSEGGIYIGWHNPGMASPKQWVEQGKKEGSPYAYREHKGLPGFTLEKGFNSLGPTGKEPRPAMIEWIDKGNIEHKLVGPIGMGLGELVPIADSLD